MTSTPPIERKAVTSAALAAQQDSNRVNWAYLQISCGNKILLPMDSALKVLSLLRDGVMIEGYNEPKLRPMASYELTLNAAPTQEVLDLQMAQLLGLTVNELKNSREAAQDQPLQQFLQQSTNP